MACSIFSMSRRLLAPRVISFDAFGTLYAPLEPIAVLYHRIAKGFGIDKPVGQIEQEFPTVFSGMVSEFPNYGKYSSNANIGSCDEWWYELITRLFKLESFKTSALSKKLCATLLDHFTSRAAYKVYPDVVSTLDFIKKKRIRMIISSNSDSRLREIIQDLSLSQYFEHEYLSYELGVSKPDRIFFDKIYGQENVNGQIWHIGDELKKDYVGASEAGPNWGGVLIERDNEKRKHLQESNIGVVGQLTEILGLMENAPSCQT